MLADNEETTVTMQLTLEDAALDVTADGVPITDEMFVAALRSQGHVELSRARPAYVARGLAAGTVQIQGEYVVATTTQQEE